MRAAALALLMLAGAAHAQEQATLTGRPIPVELPVGGERLVHFPGHVDVGIPPELAGSLEITSAGGTVYMQARAPVSGRLQVHDAATGAVHFVDVTARAGGRADELVLVRPGEDAFGLAEVVPTAAAPVAHVSPAPLAVTPIDLHRYAYQTLYAPRRVLDSLTDRIPGVTPAALAGRRGAGLYPGLRAEPVASWQGGGYYVTAVKLCNDGAQPVAVDPVRIRGDWHSATVTHDEIRPRSMTHLFVVSRKPYGDTAP